jgi:hypothetical protein
MASYRAISVACDTVVRMLDSAYRPALLDGTALTFSVYRTTDFKTPMESGITLYLYRVSPNGMQRTPPSRYVEHGKRRRPQLPLDAHFLLTVWGRSAALQQGMLGWAMRVIEDQAILPASLLNALTPDVFFEDENIELVPASLTIDEMARVWDGIPSDYQLSVPYTARMLRIESLIAPTPYTAVDERHFEAYPV